MKTCIPSFFRIKVNDIYYALCIFQWIAILIIRLDLDNAHSLMNRKVYFLWLIDTAFMYREKCICIFILLKDALLYFSFYSRVHKTTKGENDEYDDYIKSINAFSFGFFCTKPNKNEDNKHMLWINAYVHVSEYNG